jgi:hypothetical protein
MSTPSDPKLATTSQAREAAAALEDAHDRLETLRSELAADDLDRETLEQVADACVSVETVLDRWEERATDWDDFEGYVEFRNDLAETLDSIAEDIPEREAFVDADGHVKTSGVSKSLTAGDFESARAALEPAREYVRRRDALADAKNRYREAIRTARKRRTELEERIDELERLVRLGAADLSAPTEALREPVAAYNEAVEAEFAAFRREASARRLLSFVSTAAATPLVDVAEPPSELTAYVHERPAGEHSLEELLEYAGYSASKLSHYVDDPDLLKRRVATNRTYLEGVSADPFRLEWPPAAADRLWFRIRALVPLVGRFADETTVASLRAIGRKTRDDDYERLRRAAVARAELTDDQREYLEDGDPAADLAAARETLERLEEALAAHAD